MNLVYCVEMFNIINSEQTSGINEVLTQIEMIVNIFVGTVAIIGGVFAILFFRKLKEKRLDASFNYLSRLKVRINGLCEMFSEHSEGIVDRLLPSNKRRLTAPEKSMFIDELIDVFSENALETLNFLKTQNDQLPSKKGWTDMMDEFLSFLEDCAQIRNKNYFKWNFLEPDEKENYIRKHINNMKIMLKSITDYQRIIENKICSE